jgi:hypothetical protein
LQRWKERTWREEVGVLKAESPKRRGAEEMLTIQWGSRAPSRKKWRVLARVSTSSSTVEPARKGPVDAGAASSDSDTPSHTQHLNGHTYSDALSASAI